MTAIYPEATPALGNKIVKVVLALADPEAPDLSSEVNAVSSLNVSFFLRTFTPQIAQTKGRAPRRLGTKQQLDQLGFVEPSGPQLRYVYDPQGSPSGDDNKAKATLTESLEVYVLELAGKDAETGDIVASDKVNVHHLRLGFQGRGESGDGEFDEFEIIQESVYVEPPFYDVAVVA